MNEPDDPKLFENQLPALLEEELAIAQRLGVHPSRVGTDEFDQAINQGTIKWAVSRDGDLPIVPKFVEGQEISHTVLT